MLSYAEQQKILQKIIAKVRYEIEIAVENNCLEEILDKYEIMTEESVVPVNPKQHKVLVFGVLVGNINDYKLAAKKLGINPNQLEFVADYDDLKRYNVSKLEYSYEYSDIIFGPAPHKQVGMGDTSSFLALIKNNPDRYPRLIEADANGMLKLSINSFRQSLMKTRLMEANYYN